MLGPELSVEYSHCNNAVILNLSLPYLMSYLKLSSTVYYIICFIIVCSVFLLFTYFFYATFAITAISHI